MEEYQSLREEIMRRQDRRLLVLGFVITGTGTVTGVLLRDAGARSQITSLFGFTMVCFGLWMIIAGLLITIHDSKQIDLISSYIRYVEPQLSLRWESLWTLYRTEVATGKSPSRVLHGGSKPLAFTYLFLTITVYSLSFVVDLHPLALAPPTLLCIISLALLYDLHERKTSGWTKSGEEPDWHLLEEEDKKRRAKMQE